MSPRGFGTARLSPIESGFLGNAAGSELVVAVGVAMLLNLVFRIGIWRTADLDLRPESDPSDTIDRFMQHHGGAWAARRGAASSCG